MKKNETRDNIALSDIHISEGRLRKLDPKLVDTLAESMREQGQLQPILLRNRRDGYDLISGLHRLEAAKKLNTRIRAEVNFNLNDDDMLLAEIDENLIRGELSPAEQAEHLAKRKEIYERKHPETKQHVAGGKARHGLASDKLSFASATAEATSKDRRTVERGAARGEQSRLKEIAGTSLDKGIELDALAKLEKTDPAKRDTLIDLAKAGNKVSARTPTRIMTGKQVAKLVSRECRFRDDPPPSEAFKRADAARKEKEKRDAAAMAEHHDILPDGSPLPLEAAPANTERTPAKGTEKEWRRSLANMANESITLRAYWTQQFGEWEKCTVTSDLVTLAESASQGWACIAKGAAPTDHLVIRLGPEQVAAVDEWRRHYVEDLPPRAEAIVRLMEIGLKEQTGRSAEDKPIRMAKK